MNKEKRKFSTNDKRDRTQTSKDPYISDQAMKEPSVCTSCNALYRNKRWSLDPQAAENFETKGEAIWVTCPACKKIAESYPEGVVTLRGEYLWQHEEEIFNMLKNEEATAMAKNPLERIMSMSREEDTLIIETTEEKLAEHLGRALHKAHHGDLQVSHDSDHRVCRVTWERQM